MKKQIQQFLRFLTCGGEREDECGMETSLIFDNELNIESMLKQSTKIMENLRVQTECYKVEIDALRSEIVRLRLESTRDGTRGSISSDQSTDSGCSSGRMDTLAWKLNLDETLEKVSQSIPVFIDLPIDV